MRFAKTLRMHIIIALFNVSVFSVIEETELACYSVSYR